MKFIAAALGNDADLTTSRLAKLRAVAVALNLELIDRIHGGEDKDGAVRADIVIVCAVHQPEVRIHCAAADRKI